METLSRAYGEAKLYLEMTEKFLITSTCSDLEVSRSGRGSAGSGGCWVWWLQSYWLRGQLQLQVLVVPQSRDERRDRAVCGLRLASDSVIPAAPWPRAGRRMCPSVLSTPSHCEEGRGSARAAGDGSSEPSARAA